ncbi:Galactose-binding protein regulator [Gallibacterium anatis]|uniref:Galactose-binding protein regulator n=1 Tax=Gallibacterium anatis TaxID=750 RepID=A0A377H516_9PAST|nr:LysR family transcriptional regulator [Gallibacterium anatis]KGQ52977.1 LysR family transcriptional regulator [Gallibacterium anatis DSM 16844 = F 149]STO37177.1 Galactose-binding protein regulator [Gallibacterium anatis]
MKWIKRLKLKQLNLLILLAETENLSETARKANMTQPALSRWLKELEDDTGIELFIRHAKGLTPTPAGKVLIAHAKRILIEAARTQQDLDDVSKGQQRTLIIGMSPAAAPHFVPNAILNFLSVHKNVFIEIKEDTMDSLIKLLKEGELDLVIGRLDNYTPQERMQSELLYRDPICIVARRYHPLTQKEEVSWNDLDKYEWIVWPKGVPIRSRLDNAVTSIGKPPPIYRIKSTSQMANLWILEHSDMLSVASKSVVEHFQRMGILTKLNIDVGVVDGAVGMIWNEQVQPDLLLDSLIQCCRRSADLFIENES